MFCLLGGYSGQYLLVPWTGVYDDCLDAARWFVARPWCSSDARGSSDWPGWLGLVELFTQRVESQLMRLAWVVLTVEFLECWCKLDWACVCGDMCLKRVSSRDCSPNAIVSGCFSLGILMKWVSSKGCGLNDGVSRCLVLPDLLLEWVIQMNDVSGRFWRRKCR